MQDGLTSALGLAQEMIGEPLHNIDRVAPYCDALLDVRDVMMLYGGTTMLDALQWICSECCAQIWFRSGRFEVMPADPLANFAAVSAEAWAAIYER